MEAVWAPGGRGRVPSGRNGSETEAHGGWSRGARAGRGARPRAGRPVGPADRAGHDRAPLDEEHVVPHPGARGRRLLHRRPRRHPVGHLGALPQEPLSLAPGLGPEQARQGRPLDLPGRPHRAAPAGPGRRPGRPASRPHRARGPGRGRRGCPRGARRRRGGSRGRGGAAAGHRGALPPVRRVRGAGARGREPLPARLRQGRRQGGARRARPRVPQQGEQRRGQGGRPLHAAPLRVPASSTPSAARSSAPRWRPRAG